METWILAAVALYFVSVMAALMAYLPTEGFMKHMGSRDNLPKPGTLASRLARALSNYKESLFIFIPLAFLSLILAEANTGQAVMGAQIYVIARMLYLPAYAVSIWGLRSLIWNVSLLGLGLMAWALI